MNSYSSVWVTCSLLPRCCFVFSFVFFSALQLLLFCSLLCVGGLLLVGHLRLHSFVLSSGFCFVLVAASSSTAASSCWLIFFHVSSLVSLSRRFSLSILFVFGLLLLVGVILLNIVDVLNHLCGLLLLVVEKNGIFGEKNNPYKSTIRMNHTDQ